MHAEKALQESEELYRQAYDHSIMLKDLLTHDMNNILNNISLSTEIYKLVKKAEKCSSITYSGIKVEQLCVS